MWMPDVLGFQDYASSCSIHHCLHTIIVSKLTNKSFVPQIFANTSFTRGRVRKCQAALMWLAFRLNPRLFLLYQFWLMQLLWSSRLAPVFLLSIQSQNIDLVSKTSYCEITPLTTVTPMLSKLASHSSCLSKLTIGTSTFSGYDSI